MGIRKLLVANRGEIAVRIFRTCRELGISTVAVAAPDDQGALHTRVAGATVPIASYLYSEEHIRAALQTGADAIHPGYGFLAENPDFAEAVEAAGLVFVGPSPEALRAGRRQAGGEAGRPCGRRAGARRGRSGRGRFPAPRQGGGGRRRPRNARRPVARRARRGSGGSAAGGEAAFGDGSVFCERYLERPRHVEIQLLGDGRSGVLSLGERECSVQRRHQKVLEESPSAALGRRRCGRR